MREGIELNTIYNESCLDTMSKMDDKSIDLTLTDPPYGINMPYDSYEDTEKNWYELMEAAIPEMIRVSKMVIMPSCQIRRLKWFYDNFPPDWLLCWYKGSTGHASFLGFNDWEPHVVYGKTENKLYMHDYFQTRSSPPKGTHGHPCPKPYEWADWIIKRALKYKGVVYDPFTGAGTTLRAAKLNGHDYIGSEISKNYCETAMREIASASAANLFF